jgi:hypothetical protein
MISGTGKQKLIISYQDTHDKLTEINRGSHSK